VTRGAPTLGIPALAYAGGVTDLRFSHESDASRYTLHRGDDLVSVLDYRDDGRTVVMTRAYTVPPFRGHGYAAELVDRAVSQLEEGGGRKIVPVCWYVADWFEDHPDRRGILLERRSA
jgi:predicted GNAT family acetyltransferase